jgi:hypothetical protein
MAGAPIYLIGAATQAERPTRRSANGSGAQGANVVAKVNHVWIRIEVAALFLDLVLCERQLVL